MDRSTGNTPIGTAPNSLGRVVLRCQYRRLYAELRWTDDTKTHAEYLGEMTATSRADNLAAGWREAHARGLATKVCRADSGEMGGG